ncbi:hypothetical protein PHLGIDRAFT_78957 [Phlebiopsis gigantea 11061_1 CR5-6]|uniref:Ribosome biogenesis protein YTM1 n=1 Tax=Phlebiopsis gigantea (strain 11061_1 CR5-6) TaxID=745531 RepID=A0A0C3S3R6_PHLG1|nr:hypothetical protein PHLGIDRAFT_78957 [Phlebiopsis gigantea 11061_1 CR5-6]
MASNGSSEFSHPVVFTTQTAYPLPTQKFMIPASWRRYQLSQLVNKALSLDKPVPFDFLVRGEILRTTLGEWCTEKGVGEEETLEIEYIESVMPPQRMTSLPHEDWVSSVSCQEPGHFLTASYDGNLRLFDYSQKLLQTIPVHVAPITSAVFVQGYQSDDADTRLVATASHDLTARLTEITVTQADPSSSKALASLHLHTAPLTSISSSGTHLLTASADGLIGLWDTSIPINDEVPAEEIPSERRKRRKLDGDLESRPKRKAPTSVLKSHTARVSKAIFARDGGKSAVSAGFDSTVRTWDIENGVCTNTITASAKPFLDVALPSSAQTVLAASTDRTVCQYDLRTGSSTITPHIASLPHPATPSCIVVPPSGAASVSEHQVITGAYDGIVRLWDLRSEKSAITSFKTWEGRAGGRKVLTVDWAAGVVGIGGEGGVEVWRVGEGDRLPSS